MSHPVLRRMESPDPRVRRDACREAAGDPSAVLLVDALSRALGDRNRAVARAASDALAALGRDLPEVSQALRQALRGDDRLRRLFAAVTSARLAPPTPSLLPALVEALSAPDGDLRWTAARLLVDTGRLHGEVLSLLLALLRGAPDPRARRMAAYCLRELAPERPEAARALLSASRDSDPVLRRAALTALAAVVDPSPDVAARLCDALLRDRDPACRRIAAASLGELLAGAAGVPDAEGARALLARVAGGDDAELARAARRALVRGGTAA